MSVEKNLQDTAQKLLEGAMAAGATSADVVATRSTDFEVKVCDGKIVTLTEAVAKGIGLRVFVDKQLGFCDHRQRKNCGRFEHLFHQDERTVERDGPD